VGLRLLFVHGEEGDRHGLGRVVFHLVRVVARNRLKSKNKLVITLSQIRCKSTFY
jgi:hypothetical protein